MMITEDYVSFETAKLLKEKGFPQYKREDGFAGLKYNMDGELTTAPYAEHYRVITQTIAMKWLREVHRLYVEVVPHPFNFEHQDIQDGWSCEVTHLSDLSYDGDYEFFQKKYSTYEEACEAAIKYCLENLI